MHSALKTLAAIAAVTAPLVARGGSDTSGKLFFRQSCKTCHAPRGGAQSLSPLSKTQAQWKAYFAANKHKGGAESLDSAVKPGQAKDIQTFLVNHASDSPQPETCGG
jgi:cytochrome c5